MIAITDWHSGRAVFGCALPLIATLGLASTASVFAEPRVIEEVARISLPDPQSRLVGVAIDGDALIVTGRRELQDTSQIDHSAWLYQRQSNGQWTLVRRMLQQVVPDNGIHTALAVDMYGSVAAFVNGESSWIFEKVGTTWVPAVSPIETNGFDVDVNSGTIVVAAGVCDWQSNAYRKNSSGAWTLVRNTPGEPLHDCENEDTRGDVDVSGSSIIVATYNDTGNPNSARIFEGPFGTTPRMTRVDTTGFASEPVAIEGGDALVSRHPPHGVQVYRRESIGVWSHAGALLRPDSLAISWPRGVDLAGGLAILGYPDDPAHGIRTGSVSVFRRESNGAYNYVARLMASDRAEDQSFGFAPDISGRRIVAGSPGTQSVYVFELPSDLVEPATMHDTFQDGNASDWTPLAGGNFTVAPSPGSLVYRQSSTAGNAASMWNNTDRSNQSIEANITPVAYSTSAGDKWFGLVARYTDPASYYYVTLRNNHTVLLRRMVNGTFTTLASATLPINLNRMYRVRLEAIGTRLRVFVEDQVLAEATDDSLDHGRAGVMMYRMRADYDNIIVSSNPRTTLAQYRFGGENDSWANWESVGTWDAHGTFGYVQTDTTSGARSIAGIETGDQIVGASVRRIGAAGTNNWFGLATRYRDADNYYYLTIRNNNTVSLRKLLNGAIVELASAPFTVTSDTWYRLRFEAIGTHLRVYINGVRRLEASDASHPTGRYGPVMYRSAAEYDDLIAIQP